MISKEKILYHLHEREYLRKLHTDIKTGLIGTLRNEYLGTQISPNKTEDAESLIQTPLILANIQ